jgi:NitT/TauT family transport system substrate-binding protein
MIRLPKFLTRLALFCLSLVLVVSCNSGNNTPTTQESDTPVVMGYSNWAGWWPWAIAQEEGLFEKNGANVKLQWFDGYLASMEALAAGQLDANCQTLNDTVSFVADAVNRHLQ